MNTPVFAPPPLWRVELLGQLRAAHGEQTVTRFRRQKDGALLAYLAYFRDRPHPRETLIELLWPGCDPDAGRDRLSTALTSLRRQLEPPGVAAGAVLLADRATVCLRPASVTTDVVEFEAALKSARRGRTPREQAHWLRDAVDRCQGELLPGFFEEWIVPERQRLAEAFRQALGQLIRHLEREGDLERAIGYARRAVAVEPLDEDGQIDLIRLLAAAGQAAAALRQCDEYERQLDAELGEELSASVQALRRQIGGGRNASRMSGEGLPTVGTGEPLSLPVPPPAESAPAPPGTVTFLLADLACRSRSSFWSTSGTARCSRWI